MKTWCALLVVLFVHSCRSLPEDDSNILSERNIPIKINFLGTEWSSEGLQNIQLTEYQSLTGDGGRG